MADHTPNHVAGATALADDQRATMRCTGIYTKSHRDDGAVLNDKELMACGECGAVVTIDHSFSHARSHREASQ